MAKARLEGPSFDMPVRQAHRLLRTSGLVFCLLLAACSKSPTVIDGSTPETFAETTEDARRDLSIKDRLTFDTAIRTIGGRRYANNDPEAMARQTFHGMTAADVVADAHARGIE